MITKINSIIICLVFSFQTVCYSLGVMPGTENPQVQKEWDATGRKRFAAKWDECPIPFDKYARYDRFKEPPDSFPAGISIVKDGNYNKLPEAWEKSPFFREVLFKDHAYKSIVQKDREKIKMLLVKAFYYYSRYEAQIPKDLLSVKISEFEVNEEAGEVPITRIEQYKDDTYGLIIHPKFVRMWSDILINDIWVKYDGFIDQKNPDRHQEARYVSLAWGIFYRIAKHEMTDLNKKNNISKEPYRGHLTSYPVGEDTDSLFDGPSFFVNSNEVEANRISGNYAFINDSFWLWFLGSYCSGQYARYDNKVFKIRLQWIFNGCTAKKNKLNMEFPLLKEDINKRKWAMHVALNINYSYFAREDAAVQNLERNDAKKTHMKSFYRDIAKYLFDKLKKKQYSDEQSIKIIKTVRDVLPIYVKSGFKYLIATKGMKGLKIEGIQAEVQNMDLMEIDKPLDGLLRILAVKIVKAVIEDNFLKITDKIINSEAKGMADQFVSDAFYYYFGQKVYFMENGDAQKKVKGYMRLLLREEKIVNTFNTTGIDDYRNSENKNGKRGIDPRTSDLVKIFKSFFDEDEDASPGTKERVGILSENKDFDLRVFVANRARETEHMVFDLKYLQNDKIILHFYIVEEGKAGVSFLKTETISGQAGLLDFLNKLEKGLVKADLNMDQYREKIQSGQEQKDIEKVISEYIITVGEAVSAEDIVGVDSAKETLILESVKRAHKTSIEVLIPYYSLEPDESIIAAKKRMNRIMRDNGTQLKVTEYYGPENLFTHLADKQKETKRIVIVDKKTRSYLTNVYGKEKGKVDRKKLEDFRDVRILNLLDLDPSSSLKHDPIFQAQLLMTAILARLIEKGEHFLDIQPLLVDLLEGTFVQGEVDLNKFILELAQYEDTETRPDDIRERIMYFIADKRAIKLSRVLRRELRVMEYFWTFA